MIEHIQKYKIIITIALVAVGAGFVLGGSSFMRRGGAGGTPMIKIAGRTYDDREFQNLGSNSLELVSTLARSGDFGLYQFLMGLSTGATSQKDANEKFFVGRVILRQAKEEFGIHPGDEEISAYIKTLKAFTDKDGKFNEDTYRNFIEKYIGRLGMTENDLRELASDVLASRKLNTILGSGLGENRDAAATNLALENQQIEGELAVLSKDPFEEKINPTDDEIKKYWENIQDAFNTEPLRKFTYFIATPDMPAEPEADKADAKDSIADAALSDEAKKKKEAEKAKKAAELAEAKRKKQLETDKLVDDFTYSLEQQKGSGFEDLAKANKWEVKTTELFSHSKPPAELDLKIRASSRGGKAVDDLFRIEPTSDPLSKFCQPIPVGENQWLVARLDGEEKARPKTFEEAKTEARDQYVSEKAAEAMKTAANEAVTKIKAALAAGKSFADAAKEAGITADTHKVTKVNSTYRPDSAKEPKNLFESGRYVDPGSLADIITESDRTFIFLVSKREVVKEENAAARIESELKSAASRNETIAFASWIADRTEAAKVEPLYKK